MARSHGRVLTRIWTDPEFLAMSSAAQRAYMLLLSQPNLTHAGTIPLTFRRWASKSNDTTEQDLIAALRELERKRFVVIDGTSEELLVRTLIRNDNVYRQPKVFTSAKNDALMIASPKLRKALAAELRTLPIENADTAAERDVLVESLTDPEPDPPETLSDTPTKGSAMVLANPPRSARGGSPTPAPTPSPSHSPPVSTLPAPEATLQARATSITNGYHQAVSGMCNWPAIAGIVKKAIKAGEWSDADILAAVLRLAESDRPLTAASLRIECNGIGPRGRAPVNKATERLNQNLAIVQSLSDQARGEIA